MAEHNVRSDDVTVRGNPGTVASCACGWSSSWGIRDGSAESDGHSHMLAVDPEYRRRSEEQHAKWLAEHEARLAARASAPPPKQPPEHSHNCSCHLSAPCSACERCKHPAGDFDDCPNDCQECEVEHDR